MKGATVTKGYVYILQNKHMPGLIKVGMTQRCVNARAEELYQTGVPGRFEVYSFVSSPDCRELERRVHESLSVFRLSGDREFFQCDASDATTVLDQLHIEQVEEFVSEFTETHTLVEDLSFVDPSSLAIIGYILGRSSVEVCGALHEARCSDEIVDLPTLFQRLDDRKERNRKSKKLHIQTSSLTDAIQ